MRVLRDKEKGNDFHSVRITRTASTIGGLLGTGVRDGAEEPVEEVVEAAGRAFGGESCDRVLMYNPDAIAAWVEERHRDYFEGLYRRAKLRLPMLSMVPPVTPVCFASMYSGLMPEETGITKYEKPVLRVNTVFDDLIRVGKRAAIVSTEGDSISLIFQERQMDYYIYPGKRECNQKALELIGEDRYDLIVVYNGDYDYYMHRFSPEGFLPRRALRENVETFCALYDAVKENWGGHHTVMAFAPDHGCHRKYGILGDHGVKEPCDMNIYHSYAFLPRGRD